MMGTIAIRVVIGVIGLIMLVGGLLLSVVGFTFGGFVPGFWLIISGAVLMIAAAIETMRYRSEAAERGHMEPGPGGGETMPLESRFMRTDEVFIDPTSQRRMRVFIDQRSGERRYVAEG